MATVPSVIEGDWRLNDVLPRRGLPQAVKVRLVILLAQYHTVTECVRIIEEEFGRQLDRRSVLGYDVSRPDCGISPKLKALFAEARERHLSDITSVGIAHQLHRLRTLDRVAHRAEKKEDFGTVMAALRQAAEEVGGVMSNKRQVDIRHVHLSLEDAKAELAMRLGAIVEAQAAMPALPAPDGTEGETDS